MPKFDLSTEAEVAEEAANVDLKTQVGRASRCLRDIVNRDGLPSKAHHQLVRQTADVLESISDGTYEERSVASLIKGKPLLALSAGSGSSEDSDAIETLRTVARILNRDLAGYATLSMNMFAPFEGVEDAQRHARATAMEGVANGTIPVNDDGRPQVAKEKDDLQMEIDRLKAQNDALRTANAAFEPLARVLAGVADDTERNKRFQAAVDAASGRTRTAPLPADQKAELDKLKNLVVKLRALVRDKRFGSGDVIDVSKLDHDLQDILYGR